MFPPSAPPAGDEFNDGKLGLQWQWNANSQPGWHSLTERPGKLRLYSQMVPEAAAGFLRTVPNILAQKLPAPRFVVNTHIDLRNAAEGARAGLILHGMSYAALGLRRRTHILNELVYTVCGPAAVRCTEQDTVVLQDVPASLYLRMEMREGALVQFSYSLDNREFHRVGQPFSASRGLWVGAQIGLYSVSDKASLIGPAYTDVDYFRVTR